LSIDRANKLLASLGILQSINKPLPVADIFNFENDNQYRPTPKKVVGFGS